MAVTQLASATDVATALGRSLTAAETLQVGPILDIASEKFRRRSGQMFTAGTSTVRLKVNGGRVYLPQTPVTAVTTVVDDDAVAVTFTRADQWLTLDASSTSANSYSFVTVTYAHGGTVPDLVRLTIADIAKKVLMVDDRAKTGLSQFAHSEGPFADSGTYATWAVGGQTMLSPDDNALADSFRVKVPTVWVQPS